MSAIVFDGLTLQKIHEQRLKSKTAEMRPAPRMISIVFDEDPASQLYTGLKFEAANRVGIEFDRQDFSMKADMDLLREQIALASARRDIRGVMIQKPAKRVWMNVAGTKKGDEFVKWWRLLTAMIAPEKDVDCLSMTRLQQVHAGSWEILPGTVRGILTILEIALRLEGGSLSINKPENSEMLKGRKAVVVGRSDIVGSPLASVLSQKGADVMLVGSQTGELTSLTREAEILVSATGRQGLIGKEMVKEGAIVLDVGSPQADVDFEQVKEVAGFITPVPNGVGPMTVVSLLENLIFGINQSNNS